MNRFSYPCVLAMAVAGIGQAAITSNITSVNTSCHHYGKPDVHLIRLTSAEELQMITKLMEVKQPDSLGKGRDIVGPHRPDYNNLKVLSVWKIDENHEYIQDYLKRRDDRNAKHGGKDYNMSSYQDNVTKSAKARGALGANENFLFHGEALDQIHRNLCRGSSYPGGGAFGTGIYLADCSDKSDQYIVADRAVELKDILNGQQDDLVPTDRDTALVFITRAYMGKFVEIQKKYSGGFAWHDPETDKWENPHSIGWNMYGVEPDSYKVMGYKLHPDFAQDKGRGFPYRFDEFLIQDQPDNAFQYVVIYERVQEGAVQENLDVIV